MLYEVITRGERVPHTLVMTATPIPRTIAMTVFGDLETSVLAEKPAERAAVETHVVPADNEAWLARAWAPDYVDWYLPAAIPVAFFAAAAVGVLMERTVIRWLYGRTLETLLATWGLSLILIQAARVLFGAQNVEVANPSWMSGGVELLPNSYNFV